MNSLSRLYFNMYAYICNNNNQRKRGHKEVRGNMGKVGGRVLEMCPGLKGKERNDAITF